jgi:uncharacterized repeat protein (TIGR02543 family)
MQKFCFLIIVTTLLLSCENPAGSNNNDTSVSYTVSYDSQSATVEASPTSKVVSSPATTVVTLPTPPTKTGYTFGGWFTAISGGGSEFLASSAVTADITVYAKWTAVVPDSYTVSFNSQSATVDASPTSKVVTSPATTVVTLPTPPTKTEFVFEGWFTSTNGGGTEFTSTTTVNGNITVYAYWTPKPYNVGDVGPAGGIIFYDKGFYSDGWRYFEMAPESSELSRSWGARMASISTSPDIGKGQDNTTNIVDWMIANVDSGAARSCSSLVVDGVDDWFLPSKDELNLMYVNLKLNGIGGLSDGGYWSSSQGSSQYAYYQYFGNGSQGSVDKYDTYSIRAIRQF